MTDVTKVNHSQSLDEEMKVHQKHLPDGDESWRRRVIPAADRFQKLIEEDLETGCHLWKGFIGPDGYGTFSIGYKQGGKTPTILAHRFAYQQVKGPIPPGYVVHHECKVRHCCNPDHLEAQTIRDNVLNGDGPPAKNAKKTECHRGHPLTGENLRWTRDKRRACRECERIRAIQKKARLN
jgi:hypothetical protein